MNIGIVDDESIFLDDFKDAIIKAAKNIDMEVNVFCFNDGKKHIEKLMGYDIVFLDIEMPNMSGLELNEEISKKRFGQELPLVVFVTNKDSYVYTALEHYPFSFMRKAHIKEEIERCLKQARKRIDMLTSDSQFIQLVKANKILSVKDVIYIEKVRNAIIYKCINSEYKEQELIGKVANKLESLGFIRIHEGYTVNIDHVTSLGTEKVTLSNGKVLSVGRKYKESAKKCYLEWLNRKARRSIW
ncbi:MAG: response regulator transcription factor [Lachnospiraceae bacterium]|nr:response regulator transcription factor [Lachnospiraceae bacterium]